jgi:hypothetical protein
MENKSIEDKWQDLYNYLRKVEKNITEMNIWGHYHDGQLTLIQVLLQDFFGEKSSVNICPLCKEGVIKNE